AGGGEGNRTGDYATSARKRKEDDQKSGSVDRLLSRPGPDPCVVSGAHRGAFVLGLFAPRGARGPTGSPGPSARRSGADTKFDRQYCRRGNFQCAGGNRAARVG